MDATLVVGDFTGDHRQFSIRLSPSPDGCACILLATAEDVPIRLPRGNLALQVQFHLQRAGLPRLTRIDDPDRTSEVFRSRSIRRSAPLGEDDTMSTLVLCDEPAPRVVCPEAFQVAVSNWINSSNVGDGGPRLPPPAGLRLRWNCPFLSSPTPAYPTVFKVQRSQPFELAAMFVPSPTVGHLPRLAVPRQLWRPLQRSSPTVFTAGAGDCDHVQAVWLTIGANAPPVKVSLIGTDGRIRAVADVGANDRLYVEFPDLHALHLSSPTYVTEAIGLDLIQGSQHRP